MSSSGPMTMPLSNEWMNEWIKQLTNNPEQAPLTKQLAVNVMFHKCYYFRLLLAACFTTQPAAFQSQWILETPAEDKINC